LPYLIYIQLLTLTNGSLPLICRPECKISIYLNIFNTFMQRGTNFLPKWYLILWDASASHLLSDKSQPCIEKFSKTRSPPWKDITAENSAPESCRLHPFGPFSATAEALIDLLQNTNKRFD
jgi:hypothetical protein